VVFFLLRRQPHPEQPPPAASACPGTPPSPTPAGHQALPSLSPQRLLPTQPLPKFQHDGPSPESGDQPHVVQGPQPLRNSTDNFLQHLPPEVQLYEAGRSALSGPQTHSQAEGRAGAQDSATTPGRKGRGQRRKGEGDGQGDDKRLGGAPCSNGRRCDGKNASLVRAGCVKAGGLPGSLVVLTPVSEASSLDLAGLSSPQPSPSSGLSESMSESSTAETPPCQESPQCQGPQLQTERDGDPPINKQHLHCPVCKVTVNSSSQLAAHHSGSKHKLMLGGQSVLPRRRSMAGSSRSACRTKRLRVKGSVGVVSKAYHCPMCEIHVNSETQLQQHMNSRRHKDRLAGKPPKPKFSPHSKSQQSTVLPSVRWNGHAGGTISAMKKVFNSCSLTCLSSQVPDWPCRSS
ncbi:hypothetical protein ANANG_G00283370, partial [Anguilla anguilla]